jgi:hypothetical protein
VTETIDRPIVKAGTRGIVVNSMDDMWRLATACHKSGLAPKGFNSPEATFVAMQMGMELGLMPLAALRSIAVINGKPSIYGDLAKALAYQSGKLEYCRETFTGDKDELTAVCQCKRVGSDDVVTQSFSIADAKKAGLWGKPGPWTQYPRRLLQLRARTFALRDCVPDVLLGISTVEEARDLAPMGEVDAVVVHPQPAVTSETEDLNKQLIGEQLKQLPAAEPKADDIFDEEPVVVGAEPEVEAEPAAEPVVIEDAYIANYGAFFDEASAWAVSVGIEGTEFDRLLKSLNVRYPLKAETKKGIEARRTVLAAMLNNQINPETGDIL